MPVLYALLSGGLDSAVATRLEQVRHDLHSGLIQTISIHYGQLHTCEIRAAQEIAKHFGWHHKIIDASAAVGKGGLSDPNFKVPDMSYKEMGYGTSPTYVPFRNGMMLSILASQAQADPDAKWIVYGAHAEDAENAAYPDCSHDFVKAMGEAIKIGTAYQLHLRVPFVMSTKSQIVATGHQQKVPMELTWSCYKGLDKHCGTCPTCISRKEAFQIARIDDPTEYAA